MAVRESVWGVIVLFNKDDLVDKVSEMTLTQLMASRTSVEDYFDLQGGEVPDVELRPSVTVRIPSVIMSGQTFIVNKLKTDPIMRGLTKSSTIYKYASKLGAMIIAKKDYMKKFEKLYERKVKVINKLDEMFRNNDPEASKILNYLSMMDEKMTIRNRELKVCWGTKSVKVSFRPFPRWHNVLSDISFKTYVSITDVYRMAIAYGIATETNVMDDIIRYFEGVLSESADVYEDNLREIERMIGLT